jgi:hypothetical protein
MAEHLHPPVIELTTDDGVPIAAPAPRPRRRHRLLLGISAGALVLLLAVGLAGYLLLRQRLTDFATGTWDCVASGVEGEQFTFVAVITDSTFTVSAEDSDDPLTGTWRLSGNHVVLHLHTTPQPSRVEVSDIPRWLTDSSYELSGSDGKSSSRVKVSVSQHHRRVRFTPAGAEDAAITCTKR